jgi:hypothetical protein
MPGRSWVVAVLPPVLRAGVLVVYVISWSAAAGAQTTGTHAQRPSRQQEAPAADTPINVEALPISLERIGEGLERTPVIDLEALRPTFRVRIVGSRPRWTLGIDWLGTEEGIKPPAGTPWHNQYLNMVTPPQARSFGAFEGTDLLQVVGTSFVQALAAGLVTGKIKSAVQARRERRAREEVDAAIAAWKKEREADAARKGQDAAAPAPP